MKIKVINLKKYLPVGAFLSCILIIGLIFGIVFNVYGDEISIPASQNISEDKIVIIDAGHGGEDSGAVGTTGVYEKDLNLEIAKCVGEELEKQGYVVVYTRVDDRMLYKPEQNIKGIRKISDLKGRAEIASRYKGALFISIHMNSFGDERYSGLQVYSQDKNLESKRLAECIQNRVKDDLQPTNKRRPKGESGIYLLENLENTAVLIECGFLSNRAECEKLSEKEYQKQLSFSIVCAIIEYKSK